MRKKTLKNNIGIFLGRLTDSTVLQNFPSDWKKEFFLARCLSYSHIEFFLEEKKNNQNPFWSKRGRKELNYSLKKNFKTNKLILCDNYLIKNNLYSKKTYLYLIHVLKNLRDFESSTLILPIKDKYFNDKSKLINYFQKLLKNKSNLISISLETNADTKKIINFFKLCKINGIGITFDTGNVYLNKSSILSYYKSIKNYINHIHIKDKNSIGENVKLGSGLINFKKFFNLLKKQKYQKTITLETYRKSNSIITGLKNLNYINSEIL